MPMIDTAGGDAKPATGNVEDRPDARTARKRATPALTGAVELAGSGLGSGEVGHRESLHGRCRAVRRRPCRERWGRRRDPVNSRRMKRPMDAAERRLPAIGGVALAPTVEACVGLQGATDAATVIMGLPQSREIPLPMDGGSHDHRNAPRPDRRRILLRAVGSREHAAARPHTKPAKSARDLRSQVEARLLSAKLKLQELQGQAVDRAKDAARVTDDYVHDNPWQAIGIAAAVGIDRRAADRPPLSAGQDHDARDERQRAAAPAGLSAATARLGARCWGWCARGSSSPAVEFAEERGRIAQQVDATVRRAGDAPVRAIVRRGLGRRRISGTRTASPPLPSSPPSSPPPAC